MESKLYILINTAYFWYEAVLYDHDPMSLWPEVERLLKKGGN